MCKEAERFVNRPGDSESESGRIHRGALVRRAMQLLSVTAQRAPGAWCSYQIKR